MRLTLHLLDLGRREVREPPGVVPAPAQHQDEDDDEYREGGQRDRATAPVHPSRGPATHHMRRLRRLTRIFRGTGPSFTYMIEASP
jgi:hypothetical protein